MLSPAPQDPPASGMPRFELSAVMQTEPINRYKDATFTLRLELDPTSAAQLGIDPLDELVTAAHPLLQIDAPNAVHLVRTTPDSMANSAGMVQHFLEHPAGRRILARETEIPFRLIRNATPGLSLGLNVTAFVGTDAEGQARFVRRRLELPVVPGAVATAGDPSNTRWGSGEHLAVGDRAEDLILPDLAGGETDLADLRAQGKVFLFTYRGQW